MTQRNFGREREREADFGVFGRTSEVCIRTSER